MLRLRADEGGLDPYLWGFVGGEPVINRFASGAEVPAQTPLAVELSKDLVRRGFRFVGPTITYAFMQSIGLVNDHLVSCFRYPEA